MSELSLSPFSNIEEGARRAHALMLDHPGLRIEISVQRDGLRVSSRCQHPFGGSEPSILYFLKWRELEQFSITKILDDQLESLRMHVLSILGPRW